MPQSTPEHCPGSVATPPVSIPVYCPVCEKVPLHGKQTVCSSRCRIQKSMARRAAVQTERDATVRLKLREAQHAVVEALGLLEEQS
jgi:predicted nucleic acid-binding Zn ribbon protein